MKSILFYLFFFSANFVFAQQKFQLPFSVGEKFSKETHITSSTEMNANGQAFEYDIEANIYTSYNITSTHKNGFVIGITIDSMTTSLTSNGVSFKFDSNDTTKIDSSDEVFAKPLFDIVSKTAFVQIDSLGKIVKVDSTLADKKAKDFISSMILTGNDFSIGSTFELIQTLPDSVAQGKSWLQNIEKDFGKSNTQFTLSHWDKRYGVIQLNGDIQRQMLFEKEGASTPTTFSGDLSGKIEFMMPSHLITQRNYVLHLNAEIDLNATKIPVTSKTDMFEKIIQL